MGIIAITSALGVVISAFIVKSFYQSKAIHKKNLALETIKYLENKVNIIIEGSRWVQECTGDEVKEGIQRIDLKIEEYKKLPNDIFQEIQKQSRKYLSPLLIVAVAIEKGFWILKSLSTTDHKF